MLCRVVGRHCESGDIVVRDCYLPADLAPGDLLAVAHQGLDAIQHQMLGDFAGQRLAVMTADPMKHHVENGAGAGASQAFAIDGVELGRGATGGINLLEAGQIIPMHGNVMAIQQPGRRQHFAAGFNPAQFSAMARLAADPGAQAPVAGMPLGIETGDQKDGIEAIGPGDRLVDAKAQAVAGFHCRAFERQRLPEVARPLRKPVGDEQRLDRRRQTYMGEAGQQDKADTADVLPGFRVW